MPLFPRKSSRKPEPPVVVPAMSAPPAPGSSSPRVIEIGKELLERARSHKTGLLSAKFYSDWLMEWSMKDPGFKVQMFRFVDAFPMLKDGEQIYSHLTY